jgi:hypothetical protein
MSLIYAGAPSARMWQLTFAQRRKRIVGEDLLIDGNGLLALFDDVSFVAMDYTVMAVWGRRPASAGRIAT